MKLIFLLACFSVYLESFPQNSSDEKCPVLMEDGLYNTGWVLKDTIVIINKDTSFLKIERKGKGTIFSYSKYFDCPDTYDEQHSDVLTWYVPDSVSEFEIHLEKNTGQVKYLLAGLLSRFEMTSGKGTLKGVKQNNEWLITANLQMIVGRKGDARQFNRVLQFSKTFVRAGYNGNNKKKKQLSEADPFYLDN
jgi:hypothetical protein